MPTTAATPEDLAGLSAALSQAIAQERAARVALEAQVAALEVL